MIKGIKWTERSFDFTFPVGLFPCILERLRGTPARAKELVKSMSPEILPVRIDNTWSVQENVGHLIDLEELHEARVDELLAGAAVLRAADMENRRTNEANHNARPIGEILRQFREVRQRFVHRLEARDERDLARAALHPRLKQSMRLVDLAYFVAEHDDYHLARITSLHQKLHAR